MVPKMYSEPDFKIDTSYEYGKLENVPIQYDTSGEIVIDSSTAPLWEVDGTNYNLVINPNRSIPISISTGEKNKYVRNNHGLYYGGTGTGIQSFFFEGDMPRASSGDLSKAEQPLPWFYDPSTRLDARHSLDAIQGSFAASLGPVSRFSTRCSWV